MSGGAGNKPLYQRLPWGHGMHVMWAVCGVQMGGAACDVRQHGMDLVLCHTLADAHCQPAAWASALF